MKTIIRIFLATFITLGLLVTVPVMTALADCTETPGAPDVWACDNTPNDTDGMDATTNSPADNVTIDSGATVSNVAADMTTIDMMDGSLTNNGTVSNNETSGAAIFAGGNSDITNKGTVSTSGDSSTAIFTLSGDVTNDGSIQADGLSATGILTDIGNVVNNGTVSTNGDSGTGILTDTGNNAVTNNGTVSSTGAGGVAILTGPGNDTVTIGTSATVNGLIDGGANSDTLVFAAFSQSQLTGLNPAAGTFGGYSWVNFEQLTGLLVTDANVEVTIGGNNVGNYNIPLQGSERPSYPGVDDGPVKVESTNGFSIIAALRNALSQNGVVQSWFQLMGLPETQLSTTYYFPVYNNVTLSDQLRFANLGNAQTTVTVKIGSVVNQSYVLQAGEGLRVNYPGVDSGPVTVSSDGQLIIAALREAWSQNGIVESWFQLMGLPASQLSTSYYFPAYNNVTLSNQLRFANLGNAQTTVTVKIGSVVNQSYILQAGESVQVRYSGVDAGPVTVSSDGQPIIAALREAWLQNGIVESWSQLMGLPDTELSTSYYFPAYNNVTLSDQLRFANLGNAQTTVTVKIGSVINQSYVLQAGESLRVSYPGVDTGPMTVSSDGQLIIATLREAWSQNGIVESWSQLMGLPASQLSDIYYFPAYNNVTLSDQLRIAVP